jgi:hypothetical protein
MQSGGPDTFLGAYIYMNPPVPAIFSVAPVGYLFTHIAALRPREMPMPTGAFLPGETTESEKSMMYLTVFGQNRHGVSWTSGRASSAALNGKERKHSVQVTTMNGTPFVSFPFRGIQTGADCSYELLLAPSRFESGRQQLPRDSRDHVAPWRRIRRR